jgi:flagellar hook-associated protein 1 FlgK
VSTFSGLNTATTALWAQQRGLDVTGQNIANVNTAGYTRQRAELQSVGGNAVPAVYAVSNQVGQGVDADTVIRIRDAFLEGRAQLESGSSARLTVADDTLTQIEQAFREPGTTGIQAKLTAVYTAWQDVANHPNDNTADGARTAVLQSTASLVAELRTTSATLDKQWSQTRESLETLVSDVNAKAASIADLNVAIKRATQAGLPVNELSDKRDGLVLQLSDAIGATSTPAADGQVDVVVAGATLISGGSSIRLQVRGGSTPTTVTTEPPQFVTDPGGTPVTVGGAAGGKLTALTETLPRYQGKLDQVAQQIADEFNAAHTDGEVVDGVTTVARDKNGDPGKRMFDDGSGGTTSITAANLTLLISDPAELAAASIVGGGPTSDGSNAMAIAQLQNKTGGAATTYRQLIVGLGVEASVASSNLATQAVVSNQVDASRESVSGVNLDEEMTNMLQFQHAYSAAARMITTIDETLDVLINRTGRVGL